MVAIVVVSSFSIYIYTERTLTFDGFVFYYYELFIQAEWEKKALEELHSNADGAVGNTHFQDVVPDEIRQLGT